MAKISSYPNQRPISESGRSTGKSSAQPKPLSTVDTNGKARSVFSRGSSSAHRAEPQADRKAGVDRASAALADIVGDAIWHVRSEAAAAAAARSSSGKGVDALLVRYLRPPEAASEAEVATAQAVLDALKGVFAQLTPWESVSRLKAQAMEAAVRSWEESGEMAPEDEEIFKMSQDELDRFKVVFEEEFKNMGFLEQLSNESVN